MTTRSSAATFPSVNSFRVATKQATPSAAPTSRVIAVIVLPLPSSRKGKQRLIRLAKADKQKENARNRRFLSTSFCQRRSPPYEEFAQCPALASPTRSRADISLCPGRVTKKAASCANQQAQSNVTATRPSRESPHISR